MPGFIIIMSTINNRLSIKSEISIKRDKVGIVQLLWRNEVLHKKYKTTMSNFLWRNRVLDKECRRSMSKFLWRNVVLRKDCEWWTIKALGFNIVNLNPCFFLGASINWTILCCCIHYRLSLKRKLETIPTSSHVYMNLSTAPLNMTLSENCWKEVGVNPPLTTLLLTVH